jgi:hypothetical protein
MTPREQAIEAVRQMLSQTWYDGRSDRYSDTMPNLAESLVAQITPLLTADLQAAIADLQDGLARYMAIAGDESERADAAEARERQAVMTHRHVKRGTEYRIVACAKVQTDMPLGDYDEVIVYADAEGKAWVRPVTEFEDGRFAAIRSEAKP